MRAILLSCAAHLFVVALVLGLSYKTTPPVTIFEPRVAVRLSFSTSAQKPPAPSTHHQSHQPTQDHTQSSPLPPPPPQRHRPRLKKPTIISPRNSPQRQSYNTPLPSVKPTIKKLTRPSPKPNLTSILSTLSPTTKAPAASTSVIPIPPPSATTHDVGVTLTAAEIYRIRRHIARFWVIPVGLRHHADINLEVLLKMQPDGVVAQAKIISVFPQSMHSVKGASEQHLRDLAGESALQALSQCGKLPFPPGKYAAWRECIITFSPKEMAGALR